MIGDLKPYAAYKDSDVPWLGKVPEHWDVRPLFSTYHSKLVRNLGMIEKTVLSLSYGQIIVKPEEKLHGLVPESFETYQIVDPGNIIIRTTDLQNDKVSLRVGLVKDRGIITSAYLCLQVKQRLLKDYGYLLLNAYDLLKIFYGYGSGLRQNLDFTHIKRMPVLAPPIEEQTAIATFLDYADRRIRRYIRSKQKLIKLLEEEKQVVINEAVTCGLDPNVPMKRSGFDWLGEIPKHWKVKRVKNVCHVLRGKFSHRPRNDPRFYDGQYPFIQTGDISAAKKYISGYSQTLNDKGLAISKMFPAGTLAMVITGAKTGHVAILGFNACFPDSAVGFFPFDSQSDTEFLFYLFISLKKKLDQSAITSTQENLNIERIGSQIIACPPVQEQEEIATYLQEKLTDLDDVSRRIQMQITLLREFRTRLIADVVTGKLDVREAAANLPPEVNDLEPLDEDLDEDGIGLEDELDPDAAPEDDAA